MIVVAVMVHLEHGLFATNNGIELPLLYGLRLRPRVDWHGSTLDALLGFAGRWTTHSRGSFCASVAAASSI